MDTATSPQPASNGLYERLIRMERLSTIRRGLGEWTHDRSGSGTNDRYRRLIESDDCADSSTSSENEQKAADTDSDSSSEAEPISDFELYKDTLFYSVDGSEVERVVASLIYTICDSAELGVADGTSLKLLHIEHYRRRMDMMGQRMIHLNGDILNAGSEREPTAMENIYKKHRMEQSFLSDMVRLIGTMTELAMRDSRNLQISEPGDYMDSQSMPKCSKASRHNKTRMHRHHHDIIRKRERQRRKAKQFRRRRPQRASHKIPDGNTCFDPEMHVFSSDMSPGRVPVRTGTVPDGNKVDGESDSSSDSFSDDDERVRQRRLRWQQVTNKKIIEPQVEDASQPSPETTLETTQFVQRPTTHILSFPNTATNSANQIKKPKISISLNFGNRKFGGEARTVEAAPSHASVPQNEGDESIAASEYSSIKFPYPVINDHRELFVISRILKSKKREVELKLNEAIFRLNNPERGVDAAAAMAEEAKIRRASNGLRSQLRRMDTQIDYVQTRQEIERLKVTTCKTQREKEEAKRQITTLIGRMGRLHQTMKEANRKYLRAHMKEQELVVATGGKSQDAASIDHSLSSKKVVKRNASSEDEADRKFPKDGQPSLTAIKFQIQNLIKGTSDLATKPRKKRKRQRRRNGNESTDSDGELSMEIPGNDSSQKVSNDQDLMAMLDADKELKHQVVNQISSLDIDNPVMRALTAEAQKRLGYQAPVASVEHETVINPIEACVSQPNQVPVTISGHQMHFLPPGPMGIDLTKPPPLLPGLIPFNNFPPPTHPSNAFHFPGTHMTSTTSNFQPSMQLPFGQLQQVNPGIPISTLSQSSAGYFESTVPHMTRDTLPSHFTTVPPFIASTSQNVPAKLNYPLPSQAADPASLVLKTSSPAVAHHTIDKSVLDSLLKIAGDDQDEDKEASENTSTTSLSDLFSDSSVFTDEESAEPDFIMNPSKNKSQCAQDSGRDDDLTEDDLVGLLNLRCPLFDSSGSSKSRISASNMAMTLAEVSRLLFRTEPRYCVIGGPYSGCTQSVLRTAAWSPNCGSVLGACSVGSASAAYGMISDSNLIGSSVDDAAASKEGVTLPSLSSLNSMLFSKYD